MEEMALEVDELWLAKTSERLSVPWVLVTGSQEEAGVDAGERCSHQR